MSSPLEAGFFKSSFDVNEHDYTPLREQAKAASEK